MKNIKAFILNAYGLILDPYLPFLEYSEELGENIEEVYKLWLSKRLQYASLLSMMNQYESYEKICKDTLDFACEVYGIKDETIKDKLLDHTKIDCYPDVKETLETLKQSGVKTVILSNGSPRILNSSLKRVGVDHLIDGVYSTELVHSYKPSPAAYDFIGEQLTLPRKKICFVSSNSWDIAGASGSGFYSVWVNRYDHTSERLSYKPDRVIKSLSDLNSMI